jgi:hypothetical protein
MTSASLTGRSILLIEDEPLIAIAIEQETARGRSQGSNRTHPRVRLTRP